MSSRRRMLTSIEREEMEMQQDMVERGRRLRFAAYQNEKLIGTRKISQDALGEYQRTMRALVGR